MGIADRVFNLAKGYLDKASQRWDEIDEKARQELEDYMEGPESSAFDRAQKKIEAAEQHVRASKQLHEPIHDTLDDRPAGYEPPIPKIAPPSQPSTVEAAYRVLGVPIGSDFNAVKKAYDTLKDRMNRVKFKPDSSEEEQARRIMRRASAAYMLLAQTLKPDDDRFDRLEL